MSHQNNLNVPWHQVSGTEINTNLCKRYLIFGWGWRNLLRPQGHQDRNISLEDKRISQSCFALRGHDICTRNHATTVFPKICQYNIIKLSLIIIFATSPIQKSKSGLVLIWINTFTLIIFISDFY